jgi:hypothetical protein
VQRTAEECGRSAAQAAPKPHRGQPLHCARRLSGCRRTGKKYRFIDEFTARISAVRPLTMPAPKAYIRSRRAARFGAMARLRSPSLFTVNEHPAMILWP